VQAEVLDFFSSLGSRIGTPPADMQLRPVPFNNPGVPAPPLVTAPPPVGPNANYDPFTRPPVQAPRPPPPPVPSITNSGPPPGWTGGQVCDATGCRLAPVRVPPSPQPRIVQPAPVYVPPSGNTFGPPSRPVIVTPPPRQQSSPPRRR
jgi:hypothetical protein